MRVERDIQIDAEPEEIYAIVMDADRLKDWVTIHQGLANAPDGQLEEGSTLKQKLKLAGKTFSVEWTVVENKPGERVVWNGRGPMRSKAKVIYEFSKNDDGTHFSYANEYDLPGGPLGKAAGPMVRRVTAGELDESLERLKKLVE